VAKLALDIKIMGSKRIYVWFWQNIHFV